MDCGSGDEDARGTCIENDDDDEEDSNDSDSDDDYNYEYSDCTATHAAGLSLIGWGSFRTTIGFLCGIRFALWMPISHSVSSILLAHLAYRHIIPWL